MDLKDKKYFSKEISERFIRAMDRIMANRSKGKITAQKFGEMVGISSSNIGRIRALPDEHFVTIEAIGRLCHHYNISPFWIITGQGEMESIDKLKDILGNLESRVSGLEKDMLTLEQTLHVINAKNKKKAR